MKENVESQGTKPVLDPIERNSEILFGLFMALTFTGTLSVATAGREQVHTMLVTAIGCNTAWGFVDGVMYVLRNLVTRARTAAVIRAVRSADGPESARCLIADEMVFLSGGLGTEELERVRQWVIDTPVDGDQRVRLTADDLRGAAGVFALVLFSTFPVVLPFVFLTEVRPAMRTSGFIAIVMLFLCGYSWARYAGLKPIRTGLVMVLLGGLIEAVVIVLGG